MTHKETSEYIKAIRKSTGMTQIQFADTYGFNKSTYSKWEAGTVKPRLDKLNQIRRITNGNEKENIS